MIAAITVAMTAVTIVDVDIIAVIIAVAAMIVATTAVTTAVVDVVMTAAVVVVVAAMTVVVVHAVVVHVVVVVAETVDHAAAAATKTRLMTRRLMPKLTIRRQIRLKRLLMLLAKRKRTTIRNQLKQRNLRKHEDAIVQSIKKLHAKANAPRQNVQRNARRETTVQPNQTLHQSTIPNQRLKLNPNQKQKWCQKRMKAKEAKKVKDRKKMIRRENESIGFVS